MNTFYGPLQYSTDVVITGQPGIGVFFSLFAIVFLPRRLNMRNLGKSCFLYCVLLFYLCGPTAYRLPGTRYLYHLSREWRHNPRCHDPGLLCDSGGKSDTCGLRWTSYNPLPYLPSGLSSSADLGCTCTLPKAILVSTLDVADPCAAIEYVLEYFSRPEIIALGSAQTQIGGISFC